MQLLHQKKVLSLMIAALFMATATSAAEADKPSLATTIIVDVQRILDEAAAAKGVQTQLNAQRAKFQSETEKEENQLRSAEEDLTKAHGHLSAEAYSDREQQLRQRFVVVERHVDARRKMLDEANTEAMKTVRDNLLAVVQNTAHEKGANLALVKQQILWADKSLDVTDEVLAGMNKTLPKVEVKLLQEEKEGQ